MRAASAGSPRRAVTVSKSSASRGQRTILYGAGGLGKTTLCTLAPNPLFIDLDGGLPPGFDVLSPTPTDFASLLDSIRATPDGFRTLVVDSAKPADQILIRDVLEKVKTEKGETVNSIEGYGFGKGYGHLYDRYVALFAALDSVANRGIHVVINVHAVVATAPNPRGDDFLRYEPDFPQPVKIGRVRDLAHAWCDHLVFCALDEHVQSSSGPNQGVVMGSGSRSLYLEMRPTHWAKSRTQRGSIPFEFGSDALWTLLFGGAA